MELAWSVACAWWISGGQTQNVVRVFEDEGVLVCVLANAYDSGFSTCWPAGSAHLLDLFEAAWRAKKGASPTRLRAAFGLAARAFVESEVALEPRDVDFPDSPGAGSLLVAAIERDCLELAWLGAGIALVRRGDQILAANRPHTLASQLESGDSPVPEGLGHVLTRTIQRPEDAPDVASLALAHGDVVVLSAADRGERWREVLARSPMEGGAEALAGELARAPGSVSHEPFAACVVARVGARGYRG